MIILRRPPTNGNDHLTPVRATIDARSRFVTNRVMPGEYELTLVVIDLSSGREWIASVKQIVTVTSGGETDVAFTIHLPPRKEGNR